MTAPLTTEQLDAIAALASEADRRCEFVCRAPWTTRPEDVRYPAFDVDVVGADGEVVARLRYDPRVAEYIAALSPDVALAMVREITRLRAELANLSDVAEIIAQAERDALDVAAEQVTS